MSRIVKSEANKCDFCLGTGRCNHCSGNGKKKPITGKQLKWLIGNLVLTDRMESYTAAIDRLKRSAGGTIKGWTDPEAFCDEED